MPPAELLEGAEDRRSANANFDCCVLCALLVGKGASVGAVEEEATDALEPNERSPNKSDTLA